MMHHLMLPRLIVELRPDDVRVGAAMGSVCSSLVLDDFWRGEHDELWLRHGT